MPNRDPVVGDIYQDGVLSLEITDISENVIRYLLTNRAARSPIQAMPMACKVKRKQWKVHSKKWDLIYANR